MPADASVSREIVLDGTKAEEVEDKDKREIGGDAVWTLSTAKPGNGVEQLRSGARAHAHTQTRTHARTRERASERTSGGQAGRGGATESHPHTTPFCHTILPVTHATHASAHTYAHTSAGTTTQTPTGSQMGRSHTSSTFSFTKRSYYRVAYSQKNTLRYRLFFRQLTLQCKVHLGKYTCIIVGSLSARHSVDYQISLTPYLARSLSLEIDFVFVCVQVSIKEIGIYCDFKQDESYTPSKISIRAGTHFHDLQEVQEVALEEPSGMLPLSPFLSPPLCLSVSLSHTCARALLYILYVSWHTNSYF